MVWPLLVMLNIIADMQMQIRIPNCVAFIIWKNINSFSKVYKIIFAKLSWDFIVDLFYATFHPGI